MTVDAAASAALLIAVARQITSAATDARAGLLTHDAWQHAARRARVDHTLCVLLIIDLDHVKRVNDAHGHLVGDRLLAAVAAEIRHAVGEHGVAGRFGGDEFVIVLRGMDHSSAVREAEDLRRRVGRLAVPTGADGGSARITVSIGLTLTASQADPTDARWRADAALYAAKASGHNAVRAAGTV